MLSAPTSRESTAPPRIGRAERASRRPPVSRTTSSAVRAGADEAPGSTLDDCDGSTSVTARSVP